MLEQLAIVITSTLALAAPLVLIALGGLMSERSGIINIGLEGMFIIGVLVPTLILNSFEISGPAAPYIALVIGLVAGAVFSLLHAIPTVTYKADQIISGTALNLVAPALALFITSEKKVELAIEKQTFVPMNILGTGIQLTPVIFVIIVIAALVIYVLYYRPFGLHLRACGENPSAADSMGISVAKYQYIGVISSGALAGLAGASYALTIQSGFDIQAVVTGLGFLGLAALIFGQWKPLPVIAAAIFFAFFKSLPAVFGTSPIPFQFLQMTPFIVTIIALIIFSRGAVAPKALGVPYDKGAR